MTSSYREGRCQHLRLNHGTDSDWIVKLIDVYPEKYAPDPKMGGYQLMIAGDVLRGRYRNGFEKPQPIVPGAWRATRSSSLATTTPSSRASDNGTRAEHLVPVIDRNPQRFVRIFSCKRVRLSARDPASVSFGSACVIHAVPVASSAGSDIFLKGTDRTSSDVDRLGAKTLDRPRCRGNSSDCLQITPGNYNVIIGSSQTRA